MVRARAPPPVTGADHVVGTAPYVLMAANEHEWLAYFEGTLANEPPDTRISAYKHHMKWGPTRSCWNEFVFDGVRQLSLRRDFFEGAAG